MSIDLSQLVGEENVHPSEVGLAAPAILPGQEVVGAKDRLVIGYWRDAIDAEFTQQGFEYTADPLKDVLAERFDRIKLDVILTRRRRLEEGSQFRHPIPYAMVHRHNEEKGCLEFFVAQRTKQVGEEKLVGNHTLGHAGHPEASAMRFYENWTLNARDALLASLIDELDEELDFSGMTFQQLIAACPTTFSHEGFIRDDMNEVGKQHLGIVYSIGIPPHIEVTCKEDELITVGWRTLEELTDPANGFNLERWSYILADNYKRMIAEDAFRAASMPEPELDEGARYRAEAERLAKLDPTDMTLEDFNAYQETSGFDLLSWVLADGEKLTTREGQPFFDGMIDHPIDGRKAVVIALDPHDPNPVATVAMIKTQLLEGWEVLKGDPVVAEGMGRELGVMDGDLPEEPCDEGQDPLTFGTHAWVPDSGEDPEEPLDDGNGLEVEQEEDGDLVDDALDEEETVDADVRQLIKDEAPFRHVAPEPQRYDPAPHRDADVGGYGDSGGSSGSSDSGSSSSD